MDFIDDFIQEYKNNPCLWKADSSNYKNRTLRQEAYMKLIDVALKHGEHYNVERTKQKINNLRCAFRHQLKKYNEMKNKGEKEEPYCPKRKYFESLMFLKDEETRDKRLKADSASDNNTTNNGKKTVNISQVRLLSTDGELDIAADAGDKSSANNSVEDSIQVPNTLFSDICKDIQKEGNGNDEHEEDEEVEELEDDEEEGTGTVNIICNKVIPLPQDIEESIRITPIRKEQVYIVDNSAATNAAQSNSHKTPQQHHQQHTPQQQQLQSASSRKRSSSFSSQISAEIVEVPPNKTSKFDVSVDVENLLTLACRNFQKNMGDHFTSFGEVVAHRLRTMEAKQSIFAEKIISDVLYQGQMNYLSAATIEKCSKIDAYERQERKNHKF